MYLFIFESIGTSELILIGIIALIFLGPRKLPQMAKTIGKYMADFRDTTNEFKSTWEREVNFDEEERALRTGELPGVTAARTTPENEPDAEIVSMPEVRQINKAAFDDIVAGQNGSQPETSKEEAAEDSAEEEADILSDKRKWL